MLKCWQNIVIIALASLLLQGCASNRMQYRYQYQSEMYSAKRSFDAGNFKKAFCQLLPLAVAGCPEAQYALGYMYYYGYGVSEDTTSGLFWIEEAAKRHYIPAIKALKLIKHKSHVPLVIPGGSAGKEVASIQREEDQTNQPKPAKYTLQVFGSHELDSVKELQQQLQLQDSTYRGVTKRNGRDWYILSYGKYPAILQAELAKDQLPKGLKELKPWVRKTDDLQWLV